MYRHCAKNKNERRKQRLAGKVFFWMTLTYVSLDKKSMKLSPSSTGFKKQK
jgi:hypothetical protein